MFELLNSTFNFDKHMLIILMIAALIIYFILLIIPGVGVVIKFITHTVVKYVIHPLFKFFVVEFGLLSGKLFWWLFKVLLNAFKVYFYNLTHSHESIYPRLDKKKIGVIDDE